MEIDWAAHSDAPLPGTRLCAIDDVPDGGALGLVFGAGREALRIVLLRQRDRVRGFVNRCPHFKIPMNLNDGDFLVADEVLWCVHHSAQFRFQDGLCIDGPCKGGRLAPVSIRHDAGGLLLGPAGD